MRSFHFLARATLPALLAVSMMAPAHAGEADRARQAIAAARAKIDAGDKLGATGDAALLQAQARTALQSAEERLHRGRKEEAITDANHASELADRAIVVADRHHVGAEREGRVNAENAASSAQQSASEASARAEAAQNAAANANAQANALRNAPPPAPVIVQAPAPAPAPTTTTVSTSDSETVAVPVRHATRHTVHHRRAARDGHHTTTTVTTQQ